MQQHKALSTITRSTRASKAFSVTPTHTTHRHQFVPTHRMLARWNANVVAWESQAYRSTVLLYH